MYYYVNIQKLANGTSPMGIYEKGTFNEADSALHYDMWYAEQETNPELVECKCLILEDNLNPIKKDTWTKPIILEANGVEVPAEG